MVAITKVDTFFFCSVYITFKVACTSGPLFEKNKYEAVPHIFCTNNLLSDWSNE